MNDHQPFRDDLPLFLSGDLEPGQVAALETHLAGCPECREELDGLRGALDGLRRAAEVDDPDVDLSGFYEERVAPHTSRSLRWVGTLVRVAALILVFLAGMAVDRYGLAEPVPQPEPQPVVATPEPVPTPKPPPPQPDRHQAAYEAAVGGESGFSRALVAMAELNREQ